MKNTENTNTDKTSNTIKFNGVYLEKNKFYCNWELIPRRK